MQPCDTEQIMYLLSHSALHTQAACQHFCLLCTCRVTGRISGPGVSGPEGSTSAALLNRDDASIGPSEDEEASLLPDGGQGRRTTNGSLDSIFERMESQPVRLHLPRSLPGPSLCTVNLLVGVFHRVKSHIVKMGICASGATV